MLTYAVIQDGTETCKYIPTRPLWTEAEEIGVEHDIKDSTTTALSTRVWNNFPPYVAPSPESLTPRGGCCWLYAGELPGCEPFTGCTEFIAQLDRRWVEEELCEQYTIGKMEEEGKADEKKDGKGKGKETSKSDSKWTTVLFFNFILSVHLSVDLRLCLSKSVRLLGWRRLLSSCDLT